VRGWSVRSLGPGTYNSNDKGINFINQSGDIKLDASIEYRTFLFWKINGAVFVDAGNIWTIHEYRDQPGGCFYFDEFYKQIAVSYGIGLRMALDFFTLRFDGGFKAIDPAYTGRRHYPITHHNLKNDFAFHFAVGLPF
jgi:outer membrane protein assembly factor BamA